MESKFKIGDEVFVNDSSVPARFKHMRGVIVSRSIGHWSRLAINYIKFEHDITGGFYDDELSHTVSHRLRSINTNVKV